MHTLSTKLNICFLVNAVDQIFLSRLKYINLRISLFAILTHFWDCSLKRSLLYLNFFFIMIVATLVIVLVDLCGWANASPYDEDILQLAAVTSRIKALPSIQWDGVCPKQLGKCPTSFMDERPLIMVSLDGFHPDYLDRGFTPTIKNIADCGTRARFMYPVFPSKTFPNHFSQVTGLNPPSHGVIDNDMRDYAANRTFKSGRGDYLDPFWWQKEPIWTTAEKQGKKTGCFFWPGSEVKFDGVLPTYLKKYKSQTTFEERVDQVLAWLDLPAASRPRFMNLYVNQPDNAGHWYGVHSKEVDEALKVVDSMIERLFAGLQQRNLVNCVNVIISSDHGMSDIDCKRVVDIQKYIDVSNVQTFTGSFGRVQPKGKYDESVVKNLVSKMRCQSPRMRVFPKEQLPVRMHYADNARIEPIFLAMDAQWNVISKDLVPNDEICTGGTHGYDNLFKDMRGLFLAHGPSFKKHFLAEPFISTEMYEMLTELIDIKPNLNNGTRGSLHHIMTSPKHLPNQIEPDPPNTGIVPEDESEYQLRISAAKCSCKQNKKQNKVNNQNALREKYLPFGVPYSKEDMKTLRLLYNEDYISAFDLKYRIPMWSSFTILKKESTNPPKDICWTADARIPIYDTPKCSDYSEDIVKASKILQRPLFPISFSKSSTQEQASYVTNSVPKYLKHTEDLEDAMNKFLSKLSQDGELNVVTGPAFDVDATGIRPPIGHIMRTHAKTGPLVVPTHIFYIATWCKTKGTTLKNCKPSELDTNAFLLPNDPYPENCQSANDVIQTNVARVVDVEKLTGISFFTGLPIYDAVRLRTKMPETTLLAK